MTTKWRGFHMRFGSHEEVEPFKSVIEKALAPMGVNVIILEVNTSLQFECHPEVASGSLTKEDARELSRLCRKHGIRLIPLFECLGHQGWKGGRNSLLKAYPQFDETPHIPEDSDDIYCPSWCPLHPDVNDIVFDLMDELIDAFEADALHVGMDEVFEIADDKCPRCAGKNPAELFARAVKDYHQHLVGEKGVQMFIWGDRLIDIDQFAVYNEWEADKYGIAPAVDLIPKDVVICDWHYFPRKAYPSVRMFLEKGFTVWPSCWRIPHASLDFYFQARDVAKELGAEDRMPGMLVTGWNATGISLNAALLREVEYDLSQDPGGIEDIAETLRTVMRVLREAEKREIAEVCALKEERA